MFSDEFAPGPAGEGFESFDGRPEELRAYVRERVLRFIEFAVERVEEDPAYGLALVEGGALLLRMHGSDRPEPEAQAAQGQ